MDILLVSGPNVTQGDVILKVVVQGLKSGGHLDTLMLRRSALRS